MVTRAKLQALADRFIAAYSPITPTSILSFRHPDCKNIYLPASYGRGQLTNEEYAGQILPRRHLIQNMQLTVHDTAFDVEARRIIMHVTGRADTPIGPYTNEYMFLMTATEDGELVERFVEFLDSAYSKSFFAKFFEYAKKEEAGKTGGE